MVPFSRTSERIGDCVGEIANVIAGQTKAMVAGGPHQFTFSIPDVLAPVSEFEPPQNWDRFAIAFQSPLGDFEIQVFLNPAGGTA
jgi:hypothetical protein